MRRVAGSCRSQSSRKPWITRQLTQFSGGLYAAPRSLEASDQTQYFAAGLQAQGCIHFPGSRPWTLHDGKRTIEGGGRRTLRGQQRWHVSAHGASRSGGDPGFARQWPPTSCTSDCFRFYRSAMDRRHRLVHFPKRGCLRRRCALCPAFAGLQEQFAAPPTWHEASEGASGDAGSLAIETAHALTEVAFRRH